MKYSYIIYVDEQDCSYRTDEYDFDFDDDCLLSYVSKEVNCKVKSLIIVKERKVYYKDRLVALAGHRDIMLYL